MNPKFSTGYVPKDVFLIDDTIARNVAFGLPGDEIDCEQLGEACATAPILDFVETELCDGFDTMVGDGIGLSGGQCQPIKKFSYDTGKWESVASGNLPFSL